MIDLVREALDLLELEAPGAYRAIGSCLGAMHVAIRFRNEDDEASFAFHRFHTLTRSKGRPAQVFVETDRPTVSELLRGELGLEPALRSDRLFVWGALENLPPLFIALQFFVSGAAGCPSFPKLLEKFEPSHERQRI